MEERELVRAALCGNSIEATNAISKALNALILGGKQDEGDNDIEGPDVCAEGNGNGDSNKNNNNNDDDDDDDEGNIIVGDEEENNDVRRSATSKNDNTKSNNNDAEDEEEVFGINVEDDFALN